jgi:hypothetical protein
VTPTYYAEPTYYTKFLFYKLFLFYIWFCNFRIVCFTNNKIFYIKKKKKKETPNSTWKLQVEDKTTQISIVACYHNSAGASANIVEPILAKMSIINEEGRKVFKQMLPSTPNTPYAPAFVLSKEDIIQSKCQQADESLTFCWKIFTHVKIAGFGLEI